MKFHSVVEDTIPNNTTERIFEIVLEAADTFREKKESVVRKEEERKT